MPIKDRLTSNIFASVIQTLTSAILLFALYRYINTRLGIDQLGVWSVVLATASASRLADFGLGAAVIRFVAHDLAQEKSKEASQLIDTATLTLAIAAGLALPLLYPLLTKLLPYLFNGNHLLQALSILPYALLSLWLIIVATVFQGGLDGCQRMDLRAGLMVTGQILLLVFAFWLVPAYGLVGLAWAQVGQGAFLIIGGRLLLCHTIPTLPRLPCCWRWRILKSMLGYGANVQAATLFMLLLDPAAKALMALYGGAAAAGYFEMANQVVLKIRSIIVTANKAVVPHVAALSGKQKPAHISKLYRDSMRMLVFATLPVFSLLFAWAGGLSWLLVGSYQQDFVFLLGVFTLAWCSNIFAGPAYFSNLGDGNVSINTMAHAIMGGVNMGLGWLLGSYFGVNGVVAAYALSVIAGSGLIIIVFRRRHKLVWDACLIHEHLGLVFTCTAVVAFSLTLPLQPTTSGFPELMMTIFMPVILLGLAVWFHPMRHKLWRQFIAKGVGT